MPDAVSWEVPTPRKSKATAAKTTEKSRTRLSNTDTAFNGWRVAKEPVQVVNGRISWVSGQSAWIFIDAVASSCQNKSTNRPYNITTFMIQTQFSDSIPSPRRGQGRLVWALIATLAPCVATPAFAAADAGGPAA